MWLPSCPLPICAASKWHSPVRIGEQAGGGCHVSHDILRLLLHFGWGVAPAHAHCDGVNEPVATAAQRAIETGNVHLALPYGPASAEAEIVAKFQEARRVRARGRDARALADRASSKRLSGFIG